MALFSASITAYFSNLATLSLHLHPPVVALCGDGVPPAGVERRPRRPQRAHAGNLLERQRPRAPLP